MTAFIQGQTGAMGSGGSGEKERPDQNYGFKVPGSLFPILHS